MSRILMRSSLDPLTAMSNAQAVIRNVMNDNIGNMVFASSVARTLLIPECELTVTRTNRPFSKEEVQRINAAYDCFVIPLANAFRTSFEDELDILTGLVRRLKIPCIVVGVGVQAKAGEKIDHDFPFDRSAQKFVSAVLEKSSIIGVRGEVTADYLKHLGFAEERDFTVIGCPSMYMHGEALPFRDPAPLTPQTRVSVNRKINIPAKVHQFIYDSSMRFEDAVFVPQGIDDLKLLLTGKPIDRKAFPKIHATYPWRLDSEVCAAGKEIGITNVHSWMMYLQERDFSFGTRIHGSIMAVLSGTPAYIFAPDSRVTELAQYHNIPYMPAKDINEETDLFAIHEKTDFSRVKEGHRQRFDHYLDFLEANGLTHVFGEERVNRETRFDRIRAELDFPAPLKPLPYQSIQEQADNLQDYYDDLNQRLSSVKNLERYARLENRVMSILDKTPGGMKKILRQSIKKAVD